MRCVEKMGKGNYNNNIMFHVKHLKYRCYLVERAEMIFGGSVRRQCMDTS